MNLEENMTLRWDMMNDLRNSYELVGMTKRQIVDLLGNPVTQLLLNLAITWVLEERY